MQGLINGFSILAGENHGFYRIKNGGYLSKPLDSGKTFLNISINADQICMGIEADTLEK